MNIVELIDYVEASIDHDDFADDEAWFSKTMREEILVALKKSAEIENGVGDLKETLDDAYKLNDFVLDKVIRNTPITKCEDMAASFSLKVMQNLGWLIGVITNEQEDC